jgi:hypothetical protein
MQCKFEKSGKQCHANALKGNTLCFAHDPASKKAHLEAVKRGGSVRYENGLIPAEPLDLTTPKTLLPLLADTINRVRKVDSDGSLDVKRANCIANLVAKMIEAQKLLVLEERLTNLEKSLK